MNNTYLVSKDTIKTISQGALGAMTFGAYHQYTTNKIMELNNEKLELQQKIEMDKMETQHNKEINELREKIDRLESRLQK
jgi:hypothetical protein